ncbi:hypothetical protein ACROYT_G000078 [Oculina patagonica]
MSLNLGFAYFFDSAMQTATKRFSHKKLWNVVIHVVASWPMAWAILCIGRNFLPFTLQYVLILLKCLLCILQEPPMGFVYSIVYNIVAYYALFVHTGVTTFQGCIVIGVCLAFQFMGHVIFEGETPQRLPTKEDNMLFKFLDLANEFFLAPFHFSLTLMIRFDSLPILRWRSDAALHKLITLSQELKYGKKGP